MNLSTQIRNHLQAHHLPPPSQPWVQTLITARTPPPPLPSLVMTAKTRLLASDLTTPGLLDPAAIPTLVFPTGVTDPSAREARLARDVYVQVVDVENLSRSRWEQVEDLEAIERGEQTRGREVIRLPVGGGGGVGDEQEAPPQPAAQREVGGGGGGGGGASKNATHRLVLQDCKGQKVFAIELTRIPKIAIGTLNIGEKILLRKGTIVARGTVLLEPNTCHILGGKVDAWQKAWLEGRLARLKETVGTGQA
ncbi:RecQ-mediated genome instability protein 1 [Cytospora mali]|uniref:RecQ-mediated genome instability protein 1 n=1 Tax=Cytospora mali TaxID=578113 RepID=A0A194W634_CYTMA|nr:RecQ-mediated genome instability protein 1 [Valsa mali]